MTSAPQPPSPEVLAECKSLALLLAPERAQAPLYVTGLPASYAAPPSTAAFTHLGATDFAIREMLVEQSKWEGPGAVIAYCHPLARESALGILIHELGHLLPLTPPPNDFEPTESLKAKQLASMSKSLADASIGDSPTMPRWYDHHGLPFVRRCVHLHYRAWQAGYEIGLPQIEFAGRLYDLSPAWRYMRALGDEPRRFMGATFAEIEAAEPPRKFRKLFNDDFQAWWQRRQEELIEKPNEEVTHEYAA